MFMGRPNPLECEVKMLGISIDELLARKRQAKLLWDSGGGIEGARARLKFAQDYLKKHK